MVGRKSVCKWYEFSYEENGADLEIFQSNNFVCNNFDKKMIFYFHFEVNAINPIRSYCQSPKSLFFVYCSVSEDVCCSLVFVVWNNDFDYCHSASRSRYLHQMAFIEVSIHYYWKGCSKIWRIQFKTYEAHFISTISFIVSELKFATKMNSFLASFFFRLSWWLTEESCHSVQW